MKNERIAILVMLLTSICWASTFILTKSLMNNLGAITIVFLRFFIGIIPLYFYRVLTNNKEKIFKGDLKYFIIVTLLGCPLYYLLSNFASGNLDVIDSVVLSSLQCIIALVGESLFLGSIITPKQSFLVGISSVGAVITMKADFFSTKILLAHISMFTATVFWVGYCIFMLKLLKKYRISTLIYYQVIIGVITLFPSVFIEQNNWQGISTKDIFNLLFIAFICISLCFSLNAFSLKNIGIIPTSLFMNIGPIVLLFFTMINNGVQISAMQWIGVILMVLGSVLTALNIYRNRCFLDTKEECTE